MVSTVDCNKNALDVFRIIATVQVFLGHMISHFYLENAPVDLIYFVRGVPILFCLCGFLAGMALEKYPPLEWLKRRAIRILPAFWACIIINSIIILIVYSVKPSLWEGLVYGVTQFFGLNFYTGEWLRGYGVGTPNGVLWTIPVQIQFFLLAPLFHRFLSKRSVKTSLWTVGGLTVFSILCNMLSGHIPGIAEKLLGVTVLPYLYFLIAGMVGWYHRDVLIPFLQKWKWVVLPLYVVWKFAEIFLQFPHIFDGILYNTVTTLLMCCVIFAFGFCGKVRMRTDYTFGFYLYHMVFINLAVHFGITTLHPLWKGALLTIVISVLTIVFAWLSQRCVENPVVRLFKKGQKNG